MEAKDGQIWQQGTEQEEKAIQLNRQLRELQTLRVRNDYSTVRISNDSTNALVVRRVKDGCTQRWALRMLRLTGN